jgi:hypothetical protein
MSYLSDATEEIIQFVNRLPDKVLHKWYDKLSVYSRVDLVTAIQASSSSVIYDLYSELNILKPSFPSSVRKISRKDLAPSGRVVRDADVRINSRF